MKNTTINTLKIAVPIFLCAVMLAIGILSSTQTALACVGTQTLLTSADKYATNSARVDFDTALRIVAIAGVGLAVVSGIVYTIFHKK